MTTSLKQLIKVRVSLATATFACVAVLAIPFLMTVTRFNVAPSMPSINQAVGVSPVVLTDLAEIDHSIQLQGSLIAQGNNREITELNFTIANVTNGTPINLADNSLKISYRDKNQRVNNLLWTKRFQGSHNNNDLLEPGELVQFTIPLAGVLKTHLGANTAFVIDVIPPQGSILSLDRTTPPQLPNAVLDLN